MARRKKRKLEHHPAHNDETLLARLQDEHPEALTAEVDFDLHITRILKDGDAKSRKKQSKKCDSS